MDYSYVDGLSKEEKYKLLKEYWEDPKLSEERRRINMSGRDKFYLSLVVRDFKANFGFKHYSEKPKEAHVVVTKYKLVLNEQ